MKSNNITNDEQVIIGELSSIEQKLRDLEKQEKRAAGASYLLVSGMLIMIGILGVLYNFGLTRAKEATLICAVATIAIGVAFIRRSIDLYKKG